MSRFPIAAIAIAISLAVAPAPRAAQLRTGPAFVFNENPPAGTHFWCVFPDIPDLWTVALYERRPGRSWQLYVYEPLIVVNKPPGGSGSLLYQMMTVPPHTGRHCLLVAFRNGVQQQYRGWTAYNPFGWHAFGNNPAAQVLVAEIPRDTYDADIRHYERSMRRQLAFPPPQ